MKVELNNKHNIGDEVWILDGQHGPLKIRKVKITGIDVLRVSVERHLLRPSINKLTYKAENTEGIWNALEEEALHTSRESIIKTLG